MQSAVLPLYLVIFFVIVIIGFWDQVAKIEAFSKDRKITKLEDEQIIGIVALWRFNHQTLSATPNSLNWISFDRHLKIDVKCGCSSLISFIVCLFPIPESPFFHIYLFWNAIHLLLFMFISHFQKFVISNVNLICCKSLFCCSLPSPAARELFVFYRPNNTTLQTTWSHHSKIRQIQEKKHCQRHNRSKVLRTLTH